LKDFICELLLLRLGLMVAVMLGVKQEDT